MKQKMSKRVFEYWEIPPFNIGIIFCSIESELEILNELNKKQNKKKSEWLRSKVKDYDSIHFSDNSSGCVFKRNKDNLPLILFIRRYKCNDDLLATIVHETNHLVKFYSEYYGFQNEIEFNAYLQQYIFQLVKEKIWC